MLRRETEREIHLYHSKLKIMVLGISCGSRSGERETERQRDRDRDTERIGRWQIGVLCVFCFVFTDEKTGVQRNLVMHSTTHYSMEENATT
jgi:hypothetical protein